MIVVTGAAGFIGSCLISDLNLAGFRDILAVDRFEIPEKHKNLKGKLIREKIDRKEFLRWIEDKGNQIKFIFHLGARTDTLEKSNEVFRELNLEYSKRIWKASVKHQTPLIYASSAATYGKGEYGYYPTQEVTRNLEPLNAYGRSKHLFDLWAMEQKESPPFWAGLKFFNVFGPNEYHKGKMASMVYQCYKQITTTGRVRLFKSYQKEYGHGEQRRDFIYVKDVVRFCIELMEKRQYQGLTNVGSGQSKSFNQLATALFDALGKEKQIDYVEMPEVIKSGYQYFTEADMTSSQKIYSAKYSMKDAIKDYVDNYLVKGEANY